MTHAQPDNIPSGIIGTVGVEFAGEPRWGNVVTRSTKAIVATLTPAVSLGGVLGALLPAAQAGTITTAVSVATGFLTWLVANSPKVAQIADSTEEFAEDVTGRDL